MKRWLCAICGSSIGLVIWASAHAGSLQSTAIMKNALQLEDNPLHPQLVQAEEAGDEAQANQLARRILAGHQFKLGLDDLAESDLAGAAANFERVLALDPGHHRARAELARTYFSMGEFARSRREFARVLSSEPPESVQANVQHFIDRMDHPGGAPRSWSLSFTAGVLYDDNVNYGPASDVIGVAPIRFGATTLDSLRLAKDSEPLASGGAYTHLSGFTQHDLGENGSWGAIGQASYYQTWLEKTGDYAIQYGSVMAGPRHTGTRHLFDLPVRYEHVSRGGSGLVDIFGISPALTLAKSHRLLWTTAGTAEHRDYHDNEALDSAFLKVGQSVHRTFGHGRHDATLGLFAFTEDADADIYSNQGLEAVLATSLGLPLNMRSDLRAQYRGQWFDQREELAPEDRQDNQLLLEARLKLNVTPDWGVAATYQFTHNYSTFDLYEYERNFVTIGVVGDL